LQCNSSVEIFDSETIFAAASYSGWDWIKIPSSYFLDYTFTCLLIIRAFTERPGCIVALPSAGWSVIPAEAVKHGNQKHSLILKKW